MKFSFFIFFSLLKDKILEEVNFLIMKMIDKIQTGKEHKIKQANLPKVFTKGIASEPVKIYFRLQAQPQNVDSSRFPRYWKYDTIIAIGIKDENPIIDKRINSLLMDERYGAVPENIPFKKMA